MFPALTGNGRAWIYTSQRDLSQEEQQAITGYIQDFCAEWAAHGKNLKAEFQIFYNRFLILAADEDFEAASGCSIDSSVEAFRHIDREYKLDLFNRLNLAFRVQEEVFLIPVNELNQAFSEGRIKDSTLFFDQSLSLLSDLRNRWIIPFSESWAYKRIKQVV